MASVSRSSQNSSASAHASSSKHLVRRTSNKKIDKTQQKQTGKSKEFIIIQYLVIFEGDMYCEY